MAKKKIPLSESEEFKDACAKALAMYSCCKADTERCFVGGCSQEGNHCLVFFRGDVNDIFAVQEFLNKKGKEGK